MGCVYLITCSASSKQHVGLTKFSAEKRFSGHLRDAQRGKPTALHNAIRKYGPDAFSVTTLFESDDRGELCANEQAFIVKLGTRRPLGYNISGGGEAPFGELNPRFGTKHTAETKQKMRANNAMKNPVHRAKLQGENHPMYGRRMSPEAIERMRACRVGCIKMHDPVTLKESNVEPKFRQLFVELGWVIGRPEMSVSWRKNMSSARTGKLLSPETKAKMSATRGAVAKARNTGKSEAVSNLMQAGMSRATVAELLFMTVNKVKNLRRGCHL